MNINIGKLRGLQQIANPDGIFIMSAMDHRESMRGMINKKHPEKVQEQDLVKHKLELCSVLAPHSSAVLLDPIWGAAQSINSGAIPKSTGLLVSIEASGYTGEKDHRVTDLLENWGVEKIKRMGASAVKILIYFRPDLKQLSRRQLVVVNAVAEECIKFDIPFLVEPVTYPVGSELDNAEKFAAHKGKLVIQTARDITSLPIDVLKSEFPADLRYQKDKGKLIETCRELDATSRVPWVILSAGVNFDLFSQQVEIACKAGASGFLAGRAIWQEAMEIQNTKERVKFLSTVAVDRLKKLTDIASKYAVPWYKKAGFSNKQTVNVSENWYKDY